MVLKCNMVCNFLSLPQLYIYQISTEMFICLSLTYVDLYCLLKSLATSGVCCLGRSGNTPSGHSLICFPGHHLSSGVYIMSLRQSPSIIGHLVYYEKSFCISFTSMANSNKLTVLVLILPVTRF